MANNVQFQSSVPATPSSATIVETIDQGAGVQRQTVHIGSILAGTTIIVSSGVISLSSNPTVLPSSVWSVAISGVPTVTLSSNPTVIPSSAVQVTLTSNTVALSSVATVTPSSAVTVTPSSVNTVTLSSAPSMAISSAIAVSSGTVTLSSNPTVILSSNPTVILSSAIAISSGTFTLSSNPTVIPSSVYTVTLSSNPTVIPSSVASVTLSSNVTVQGDAANAATDTGNPVKIGGIYNSTNPTSVTSGQRVNAWYDKSGKQIVNSALRALKGVQLTAISCSTTETNITPSSTGGNFLDIYGLVLSNLSTTSVQQVTIKDSSGGTSRMIFEVPFGDTRGFMVPVDAAVPQSASSQAWSATLGNSSGPFQITALYVTNI